MRRQRLHYSGLAREINVTQKRLYAAARGIVVPSPVLSDKLPAILGVPLSRLFTAEALDYRYQDNHHRFDCPQRKSRKALVMNQQVRDALRRAGAEAGRKARWDAGLPEHVEDHQAVQRMAELLIKAGGRRDAA